MGTPFSYLSLARRARNGIVDSSISDLVDGTALRTLQFALRRHVLLFGCSHAAPLTVAEAAASCGIATPTFAFDGSSDVGDATTVDASELLAVRQLTSGEIHSLWLLDSEIPWTHDRAAAAASRFYDTGSLLDTDAHCLTTVSAIESNWSVQSRVPELVDALIDAAVDQLVGYLRRRYNTRIALSRDKQRIDVDLAIRPAPMHELLGSPDDWAITIPSGNADVDSIELLLQVHLDAHQDPDTPVLHAVARYDTRTGAWTMTFVG